MLVRGRRIAASVAAVLVAALLGAVPARADTAGPTPELPGSAQSTGTIAGTVTASTGGGLSDVTVEVFDSSGNYVDQDYTAAGGSYAVTGLAASSPGYVVCFDASSVTGGSATAGYANQCWKNLAWRDFSPPAGATKVPVSSGGTTSGINAALTPLGAIAGTVTAASGGAKLAGVFVEVFDATGQAVGTQTTDPVGAYRVPRLTPSTSGYAVCFDASNASGGAATGYASQCWKNAPFEGSSPSSGATKVPVSAGVTASGISPALGSQGGISGTVRAVDGAALADVRVEVLSAAGDYLASADTGTDGTYAATGLTPSSAGYVVCFGAGDASGGTSTTGYANQCWKNVTWDGFSVPGGVTRVPVNAGSSTTGINATLTSLGAIAGTVTAATGGGKLSDVQVRVSDAAGNGVASAYTDANGGYVAAGLTPSSVGYTVCFDASDADSGGTSTGLASQCWKYVAWDGSTVPTSAVKVAVAAGVTATGINAALTATAAIAGTVTAAAGGAPLAGVQVSVRDGAHRLVGSTTSSGTGSYRVVRVPVSSSGYSVCFDAEDAEGGSSTGYADQCWKNVAWDGSSDPPAAATKVAVSVGGTVGAVNAALGSQGAISGTVTAASGGGRLAGVSVRVFTGTVETSSTGYTDGNGAYRVTGLAPSSTGYVVCFDANSASGGTSSVGYADQCWKNVAWDGVGAPPGAASKVPVTAGGTAAGIDAALGAQGAIAGTVTAASGGGKLADVSVQVRAVSGNVIASEQTDANGAYRVAGLTPSSSGYLVCFDAGSATGGSSSTGYADQCWKNVAWNGTSEPPAAATKVPVAAGSTVGSVNAALAAEGALAGKVTSASGGGALADLSVKVFDAVGRPAGDAYTDGTGTYRITGIAPGTGYAVCFDARSAAGGSSSTGYADQCWKGVAWDGSTLPTGRTKLIVTGGSTTGGVDAALGVLGAIGGTVRTSGGTALADVVVEVFDDDDLIAEDTTAADGSYRVVGLSSGEGYTVCFDAAGATGGSSPTGYTSQCYRNLPWDGGEALERGITPVHVSLGSVTTVNAGLLAATGIAGTVRSPSGTGLGGVVVSVYDESDVIVAMATTETDGTYAVRDLATSSGGFLACFDARGATGGSATTGYASQCSGGLPWAGIYLPPPAGATRFTVASASSKAVNATLVAAGAFAGTVTAAASGSMLAGVSVDVFDGSGHWVASVPTGADGHYRVPGLQPSSAGYTVCFDALTVQTPGPTGYSGRCRSGVAWGGGLYQPPPAGTTLVPLAAGTTVTVDMALPTAGAVSGSVRSAAHSTGLAGVAVQAYDSAGHLLTSTTSSTSGAYTLTGLIGSSSGYHLCFDASAVYDPAAPGGYDSRCYPSVPWTPPSSEWSSGVPAVGSTGVPITSGATKTGIDVALPVAASQGVRGVLSAPSGAHLGGVAVTVYDGTGTLVSATSSGTDGSYSLLLAASPAFHVCFDGTGASSGTGSPAGGYGSQCSGGVGWRAGTPPPAGAAAVVVSSGVMTTLNATLPVGARMSGAVTAAGGTTGIVGVAVDVFDGSGALVATTTTGSGGAYLVGGLAASSAGYAVCFDPSQTVLTTGGWAGQCWHGVGWTPGGPPSPRSTPVRLGAGAAVSGVNASIGPAAGLAGVVRTSGGTPLAGVAVDVFDAGGALLSSVPTQSDGSYLVTGLPGGEAALVCFDPTRALGASAAQGFAPACAGGVRWLPSSPPTAGTASVSPAAGARATVNATLATAGAVSGTVTTAGGTGLPGVRVRLADSAGNTVVTQTSSSGTYTVSGLPAGSYTVCADGSAAGGGAGTGFGAVCSPDVAWSGGGAAPPSGATPVAVTADHVTNVAEAHLAAAGAISGKATATSGGAALAGVSVTVFGSSAQVLASTATASDGTYTLTGVPPSATGYAVCFDAGFATGGSSTTGYVSRCSGTTTWNTNGGPASGATHQSVTAGATHTTVNAPLVAAGAIGGTVSAASGGAHLGGVDVVVFDGSAALVALGHTNADGTFAVGGLAGSSSGYSVCFDASRAVSGALTTGYASQCWKGEAWAGDSSPASGTTRVPVSQGASTGGLTVALAALPAAGAEGAGALLELATSEVSGTPPAVAPAGQQSAAAAPAGSADMCDPDDLPGHSEGPDNDGDECTFTVDGKVAFPSGGADQVVTTPATAWRCEPDKEQEYLAYARTVMSILQVRGATTAVRFLQHWLDGSGTPLIEPDGSTLSRLAKSDPEFTKVDDKVQQIAKDHWNTGQQHVTITNLYTLNFGLPLTAADLFYSFGGTQGLTLHGTATNDHGSYVGTITYTVTDTYGWNELNTFTKNGIVFGDDFRPKMNYLQTYCGQRPTRGKTGPHWFQSGVVMTVPIR